MKSASQKLLVLALLAAMVNVTIAPTVIACAERDASSQECCGMCQPQATVASCCTKQALSRVCRCPVEHHQRPVAPENNPGSKRDNLATVFALPAGSSVVAQEAATTGASRLTVAIMPLQKRLASLCCWLS